MIVEVNYMRLRPSPKDIITITMRREGKQHQWSLLNGRWRRTRWSVTINNITIQQDGKTIFQAGPETLANATLQMLDDRGRVVR